jgi:hypothetical protein
MESREYVLVILYVDNILIMSASRNDREWVKDLLENKYEKISVVEGNRMTYLGLTLIKNHKGYEVCMRSYIEDVLKQYGKPMRDATTPAKPQLFNTSSFDEIMKEKAEFHSIVAKLLYLGNRGRPDVLLPVQYLCTRFQSPMKADVQKLERVLGYLQMMKRWSRAFDNSPFERVGTYIDASFATHPDGKGQSGCLIMLGKVCKKQTLITQSSTEAELLALSDLILEGEMVEELSWISEP